MKEATAYRRIDGWYVSPKSQTTTGLWIGTSPLTRLPIDSATESLGQEVAKALVVSQEGIQHPKQNEWPRLLQPLLDLYGAKSWSAFATGAACASISADDHGIVVAPWKNAGAKSGFVPIPDVQIQIPRRASELEIGEALLKAMAIAEQAEWHHAD